MIRVALVDDQELIRAGLRTILDAHPATRVVAEAADGLAALRVCRPDAVDVVLMDVRMPGIDGVEATRRLRAGGALPRILVLTTFDQDENVLAALRAGADGFLSKGAGPAEIVAAVERVAAGGRALSPGALDALVDHVAGEQETPPDPDAVALLALLTPREREVVEAAVRGWDNAQIGARLHLSPLTVKTHANRAMTKVGARDRAQLVSLAVRAGVRP
ncbi:response regulator transcription factor [Cellulomonas sp. SLBN-39]|uniref:response regulator n=1 Tax=Cellulomonas sp. SLBN-39 TaxID=2768446 RepID=UPI00114D6DBB|nr:response regulator transcription factor [Cellulomonas sp. SLBN-39]TQL01835.1 LuxR family two component transcriptional regulator [Cellulomonas sp. SLBN-39]